MLNTHFTSPVHSSYPGKAAGLSSPVISRLLSAAVINRSFRELLLSDPARALSQGFQGEKFPLDRAEQSLILSIQAETLGDLAAQISSRLAHGLAAGCGSWVPVNQPALVMDAE